MSILIAILIFGIIIAIHELGHFLAARACDVKIHEFAIGMGPTIFKRQKGEIKYALRLLPIGGFVSMEGEDESSTDNRALNKKPVWQRICISAAGAFMNLILGFIVIVIMISIGGNIVTTEISKFTENAVSNTSGLMENDEIKKVNNISIYTDTDLVYALQSDDDATYNMVVKRNGKKVTLKDVKLEQKTNSKGAKTTAIDFSVKSEKKNVLNVISYSFKKSVSVGRLIWFSLGDLISGKYSLKDMSGPVGIVGVIGDTIDTESGINFSDMIQNLLFLIAFITINVGIFNLIPFPALDGGRIVFLIIEGIRGKQIKPEREGMVHFIGLVLLMILMVVVTFSDVINLF